MHKMIVSGIVAFVTGLSNAQAMTATPPAGLVAPMDSSLQDIQYYGQYCKTVWRCGPYGYCGWRNECYFPPSRRWGRMGCPRGYTVQDGWCKPYRGY
jgi:hypothetical protein